MEKQYLIPSETFTARKVRINSTEEWIFGDIIFATHQDYYYVIEMKEVQEYVMSIKLDDIVTYFKSKIKEDPRIIVNEDFLQFLLAFGFSEHDIAKIRLEIDKCLNEMALEKTGFNLDEESKTLLRNELVLASLVLASK